MSTDQVSGADFTMPSLRLDGRRALVVGASRGLGLGVAQALAHAGADIALAARSADGLESAAALVRQLGAVAVPVSADVTDLDSLRSMVDVTVERLGQVDVLVNAAGVNIRRPAVAFTEGDWEKTMAVNLKSAFFAAQYVGEMMRERGAGKIINIGSLSSEIVLPGIALYAMSKGGLRQLTRALAVEWAAHNVQVNAIAPGRFWTAMTDAVFSDPELHRSAVSVIPQGRPGTPRDLAGAAVLLASEASDYITGQTIVVDGGWMVSAGAAG